MAWIPACKNLSRKREVVTIAEATGRGRQEVVGWMVEFWSWVDDETANGFIPGVRLESLPRLIGADQAFWLAVVSVGWLQADAHGLTVPNFDRWLGQSAKRRVQRNANQAGWRRINGARAPTGPNGHVDAPRSLTGQDSTEENKDIPPLPPKGGRARRANKEPSEPDGFGEFWSAYPRKEAKARAVEAWARLQPDPPIRAAILDALSRQRISGQWSREGGRYIPLPATYLNQRRWEDEPSSLAKPAGETEEQRRERVLRERREAATGGDGLKELAEKLRGRSQG